MVEFRANTKTQQVHRFNLMGLPGGSYLVATESSYVGDLKLAGGMFIVIWYCSQDLSMSMLKICYNKNPDIILRTSHAMPEK